MSAIDLENGTRVVVTIVSNDEWEDEYIFHGVVIGRGLRPPPMQNRGKFRRRLSKDDVVPYLLIEYDEYHAPWGHDDGHEALGLYIPGCAIAVDPKFVKAEDF